MFEEEAARLDQADCLVQGTIYSDVIGYYGGPRTGVGVPAHGRFRTVLEPTRMLFKDEVRVVGGILGIPDEIIDRQPFPGPGLAVRCLGDITREKLEILRGADKIFLDEINRAGLYDEIWQAFAVLLPVYTVGVMGDERTYARVCALRAITSRDGMTAEWYRMPHDVLDRVSTRICNEVRGINRVVYDCTSKPPATVEWE